ncbi:TetR/AcrR family transcriptional regulator C-terminal domain-containing protein [Streptomyces erythrochromogenes]|uniref:TetR/AcrR family transcriptional regulator n=1 Tax=Streptomyces erythrochromogenes TaxID=285574 RepID=UPI003316E76E
MTEKANAAFVPSVWVRPTPAHRLRPALSRDVIVREAIAVLDEAGSEALTMRKLGARLNAGATSFYRHVTNRDELLELAVDEVLGEVLVPQGGSPDDWRSDVTAFADAFRATALRHPWLCAELGRAGMAYLGPNLSALTAQLTALLAAAGYPDPPSAINALYSYAIGMSTTESAWLSTVARSGQSEAEFLAQTLRPEPGVGSEDLRFVQDPAAVRDEHFASGLGIVLDGLATRLRPQA